MPPPAPPPPKKKKNLGDSFYNPKISQMLSVHSVIKSQNREETTPQKLQIQNQ